MPRRVSSLFVAAATRHLKKTAPLRVRYCGSAALLLGDEGTDTYCSSKGFVVKVRGCLRFSCVTGTAASDAGRPNELSRSRFWRMRSRRAFSYAQSGSSPSSSSSRSGGDGVCSLLLRGVECMCCATFVVAHRSKR